MRRFDDFDAWGEVISGASLRMACDSVETRCWTLGMVGLGDAALQTAFEGGGNICYGGNSHAGTLLFVPLSHAAAHIVNGEPLDDDSLFAIPQGADFRIRVRRQAHAWCSIALPFDLPAAFPASLRAGAGSTRIACRAGSIPRLRNLVHGISESLLMRPIPSAAHLEAGRHLLAAVADCLLTAAEAPQARGRPPLDRADIIRRAMAAIETAASLPTAADLADAVGVTSRTLLRSFQESFDISPKRYLLLRALHTIRRDLLTGDHLADATVADVLTRRGIWEFGRFAARYRRHFGELPSETLRRARA